MRFSAIVCVLGCLILSTDQLLASEQTPVLAYEDVTLSASADWVIANSDKVFSPLADSFVGQSDSAWWVRITLENPTATQINRFVIFPYQRHISVTAFRKSTTGELVKSENGTTVPVSDRAVKTGVIAFGVVLQPEDEVELFVRITNSNALWLTFDVVGYDELLDQELLLLAKLLFLVSTTITLLLLNLEGAIRTRSKLFFSYTGYLMFGLLLISERFSGWEYLGLTSPLHSISIGALMLLAITLVIYRLFPLSNDRLFSIPIALSALTASLLLFVSLIDPVSSSSLYRSGVGGLGTAFLTWALGYAAYRKMPHARLALFGWSLFVFGAVTSTYLYLGILPVEYTGIITAGLLGEALIFSLILSSNERYQLQRKRFEEQQRSKIERTSQLALIGEQSAILSHELKQPLNAIKLMAANLTRSLSRSDEKAKDQWPDKLGRIDQMADRAIELTEFVRRSARHTDDDQPTAGLNDSLISIRLMLGEDLARSNIELVVQVADDFPLLRIHPLRLDQILINIIGNARDAIRSVEPEERWVKVSAAPLTGEQVEVAIEDSAGGIAEHLLADIFTRFFTTKDASTGTGLGLAICRDIAEEAGGSISVSNTENGARFVLKLPSDAAVSH